MGTYIFLVLLSSLILFQNSAFGNNTRSETHISEQFYKYMTKTQNAVDKDEFKKLMEILSFPQYIYRNSFETFTQPRMILTCIVCRSVVDTVLKLQSQGKPEQELIEIVTDLCTLMEIQSAGVCQGVIKLNLPIILYIMRNKANFKANSFCGVAFQSGDRNTCPFEDEEFDWTIDLPEKNVTIQPRAQVGETFKIVHLSDFHYDPVYEPFGLADCNEPTCCRIGQQERASARWNPLYNDISTDTIITRKEDGSFLVDLDYSKEVRSLKFQHEFERNRSNKAIPIHKQAGYWGDYRHCDAPLWAIEDCINRVAENHKDFEYVYYTGDTTDHGVWETTHELIAESQTATIEKLTDAFGDIPVFPIIGNHESQPVNQYAPTFITDSFSSNWLYTMLAQQWSRWLPKEATETIKLGGYYTVSLKPGFRVVAINSNVCYRLNWWLQMQPKDLNGQLQWLADTLRKAELNNEKVHILSHIPAGRSDCLYVYTKEYKRIVERFSDIIAAEFNGHTHSDDFKVFYSKNDTDKPIAVAWNGGSVTANDNINPNYRVYDIDSNNYEVANIETWIFNLTEANLTPQQRPRWFKEYTFKEHYGLESLSLKNLDNLINRMVTTEKHLLQDYHKFRSKSAGQKSPVCNGKCVHNYLRIMTSSELYDFRKGDSLWDTFNNMWHQKK